MIDIKIQTNCPKSYNTDIRLMKKSYERLLTETAQKED